MKKTNEQKEKEMDQVWCETYKEMLKNIPGSTVQAKLQLLVSVFNMTSNLLNRFLAVARNNEPIK